MRDPKTRAAEALSPMLSAFHCFTEQRLDSVWETYNQGSLERLTLVFSPAALAIRANADDDSIDFFVSQSFNPDSAANVEASQTEVWKDFIGKPFGWGWVTINQQGYCDGLLLSFEGIRPAVLLNVLASSIKIGLISAVGRPVVR
jgi:hypothetical protein